MMPVLPPDALCVVHVLALANGPQTTTGVEPEVGGSVEAPLLLPLTFAALKNVLENEIWTNADLKPWKLFPSDDGPV